MSLDPAMLDRIGTIACETRRPACSGVTGPVVKFPEKSGLAVYRKAINPYLGTLCAANHPLPAKPE